MWEKLEAIEKRHHPHPWEEELSIQSDERRHWKAIKDCLRMSHISLNPETWETLSIASNHSSASVPWSQICWAQASDVGSYPHRPTRPRPPTFFYTAQDTACIERLICSASADPGRPWTNGWREKVKISMSPFLLLFPLAHMGIILYRFKCYIENKLKWPKCFTEQSIIKIKPPALGEAPTANSKLL